MASSFILSAAKTQTTWPGRSRRALDVAISILGRCEIERKGYFMQTARYSHPIVEPLWLLDFDSPANRYPTDPQGTRDTRRAVARRYTQGTFEAAVD
jgi:hypothetical protein